MNKRTGENKKKKIGDDNLQINNEVYQQDEKDLDELTRRFRNLDLPEHESMIINDYIACIQTIGCRYADISYMAGIEDAITLLKKMDLIKNTIE